MTAAAGVLALALAAATLTLQGCFMADYPWSAKIMIAEKCHMAAEELNAQEEMLAVHVKSCDDMDADKLEEFNITDCEAIVQQMVHFAIAVECEATVAAKVVGCGGSKSGSGDEGEGDASAGGDSDDDDDMPPLVPAESWEPHLGQADEAGVPSMAKCQLSGALMHDPVATPDGYLFERAALEDWTHHYASNPLTGAPLQMAECTEAKEVASFIQGYQLQMLSACAIAPEAFDEPPPPDIQAPVPSAPVPAPVLPPPAPAAPAGPSLLGDLPSLGKEEHSQKKKDKAKIRIESRSVVDCPDDMRCAVDGKVMVNPVRSPYGHCFEKKTLERWMQNCGSVCPITQQPLRLEDCTPDAEMKKRIIKFLKGQS